MNKQKMHARILIKVASPVKPIYASNTIKIAEPMRFPTLPSSSSTVIHELVLAVYKTSPCDLHGNE